MSVKRVTKINIKDDLQLSRVQENVTRTLDDITGRDLLGGIILTDIALVTGRINEVSHLLGDTLTGWMIVDQNAQADIWRDPAVNQNDKLTLNLRTSADVTVKIWVF